MRVKFCLLLVALCGLMPATADVIFDNEGPDDNLVGFYSDYDQGVQVADDFELSEGATIIRDVHWWGGYDPEQFADDDFDLFIYADEAGLPGAELFELTGSISRSSTGLTDPLGFDIFGYDMVLASEVQLDADTTYWLSIINRTDSWFWQSSGASGVFAHRFVDDEWHEFEGNMAFNLTNDVIPEPASMALLGLGLAGLALRRWKTAI